MSQQAGDPGKPVFHFESESSIKNKTKQNKELMSQFGDRKALDSKNSFYSDFD